jgi:peroxiredoxin
MKKVTTAFSLLLLAVFFGYNYLHAQQVDSDLIGKVAPAFNLKNIDGKMVSLDNFKADKGAIVIFTCNHCPYSKMYEDRIVALDAKFKGQGFPVVAINPNDPTQYPEDGFEQMKKRAKKKRFTFPYLVDDTQDIAKAYGATRTPHIYLVQNDGGKMVVRYVGAIDDNAQDAAAVSTRFLEDAIAKVAAGQAPDPGHTKAVGCGIKWKGAAAH